MDSFINKLTEAYAIKPSDYTVFDIANSSDGLFYSNKISYYTLSNQISSDVYARLKALLDALQNNLNTANTNIARKLDKAGLSFNLNEKMTGTLYLNSSLCATGISYFSNLVTVDNNFISMVKDPVLPQDAVNFRTLTGAINSLSIPNGNDYIKRSGDLMTGGFITAATDAPPTDGKHLANKKYVDDKVAIVDSKFNTLDGKYVIRTGDTMLGSFYLTGVPQTNNEAANKQYVDERIRSIVIPNVAGFVIRTGDTMLGSFYLTGAPQTNNEAANKQYVDERIRSIVIPNVAGFVVRSGDTMTGSFYLTGVPQTNNEAANKQYVDERTSASIVGFASIAYVDTTFIKKRGDTMTGSLYLTGAPQQNNEAATKKYVEDLVSGVGSSFATLIYVNDAFLRKSGDIMTAGNLTLSAEPATPKHATTKRYVDNVYTTLNDKITALDDKFVNKNGDVMGGSLHLLGFQEGFGVVSSGHLSEVTLPVALSGNTFEINVSQDITAFNVTGVDVNKIITINLVIKSNASNLVTWNFKINNGVTAKSAKWAGGVPPIVSRTVNTDIYTFTYINGNWYGFVGGQGF